MTFTQSHKIKKEAKNVLHDAKMTLNMNRDLYDAETVAEFEDVVATLAKARASGGRDPENLERVADKTREYTNGKRRSCPLPFLREWIETFVVAIGVAMAFRAYFFQPFKIPTGSMQPTLYGIHSETLPADFKPGPFDKMPFQPFKWAVTGVWYKEVVANSTCSVAVYEDHVKAPGYMLVFVGGVKHKVPVDAFFAGDVYIPNGRNVNAARMADSMNPTRTLIATGEAQAGDVIWKGRNISGDQLFVNRIAWNFRRPKRDDVIVFSTSRPSLYFSEGEANAAIADAPPKSVNFKIPVLPLWFLETTFPQNTMNASDPGACNHYIKRLVGMPGETITISAPHVCADGEKITGLFGMDRVANAKGYDGYLYPLHDQARYLQIPGDSITLGAGEYLPMGDNTHNSSDGRFWGSVPRQNMLGPAAFVYWPISSRWGRGVR